LTTLLWIILATTISGVLSVLAAGIFLALPARAREAALPHLVPLGFRTQYAKYHDQYLERYQAR
jgi:hypothetical protein